MSFGVFASGLSLAQQAHTLLGVNCAAPPAYHCPDTDCSGPTMTQPGDTVELKTRRSFFLDCPSDYKPGDKVNILVSLSISSWPVTARVDSPAAAWFAPITSKTKSTSASACPAAR
jgi:hypothetical protein